MSKRKELEIIKEWTLNNVDIKTNVGKQTTDLKCKLEKRYMSPRDITLFERFIIGYRNYFYRIDVEPVNPIRQNRDKDWLGGFSEEGNDATYNFSLGLGIIKRGEESDLSDNALNERIYESLRDYDPNKKREPRVEKWTNKTLMRKCFNHYHNEIGLFTAIYPFHGSDLSGWTDIISVRLSHDNENGFCLDLCLLGFHLYGHSRDFEQWFLKLIKFNRPKWPKGMQWEEYNRIHKQWAKEHPVYHFFDIDWSFEIGLNRAKGLFYSPELDGCRRGNSEKAINLFRNKLWNLI